MPSLLGVPTRIGGFGGNAGFETYLDRERIDAVLDATDPFAASVSHRTVLICGTRGIPYAQLLRPSWRPGPEDRWVFAEDEGNAANQIPAGSRVLVATGQERLKGFGTMPGRRVFVRQAWAFPSGRPPFADGYWIAGQPPFDVEDEVALFRALDIDWLVVRNAGGSASRSKLDAARALGIQVAMLRRPLQPEAIRLDSVAAALAWVRKLR